jgi:hypothetical protein
MAAALVWIIIATSPLHSGSASRSAACAASLPSNLQTASVTEQPTAPAHSWFFRTCVNLGFSVRGVGECSTLVCCYGCTKVDLGCFLVFGVCRSFTESTYPRSSTNTPSQPCSHSTVWSSNWNGIALNAKGVSTARE